MKAYGGYRQNGRLAARGDESESADSGSTMHGLMRRLLGAVRPTRKEPLWGLGCDCFAF